MNREQKDIFISYLKGRLDKSKSIFLTDFRGLNVGEMTNLRRDLRKIDSEFKVVKNTLVKLTFINTELEPLNKHLEGPTAFVFCYNDPVETAKILKNFIKGQPILKLKGGFFQNSFLNSADILSLADLPGRNILLMRLLNSLIASQRNLVYIMNSIPSSLVGVLNAIKSKKEAQN